MILALDLSSKCTGWSKFSKDGKLMDRGRITPDSKIDPYNKIHYVTDQVKELFGNCNECVIEDLFFGKNFKSVKYLARLSGAIIYAWIVEKYKIPHFYMAVSARKLSGCNARSHKAEVQLYICQIYTFATKKQIVKYEEDILVLKSQLQSKAITKGQFKYRMDKVSKAIDKETGIGEDVADSIVLNIAYYKDNLLK